MAQVADPPILDAPSGMMRDELLPLIKSLRSESAQADFELAMRTVSTLLSNILENPEAERFRTVRLANGAFHSRVGRFPSALPLLRTLGFEDALDTPSGTASSSSATSNSTSNAHAPSATHLAMPTADVHLLAEGLVLLEASMQASALISKEEGGGGSDACDDAHAAAGSKRPIAGSKRPIEAPGPLNAAQRRAPHVASDAASATCAASASAVGGLYTVYRGNGAETEDADGETLTLSEYTSAAIDGFFSTLIGAEAERLPGVSAEGFGQLAAAAADAERVARATGDAMAEARAAHWRARIRCHGESCGWQEPAAAADAPSAAKQRAAMAAPSSRYGGASSSYGGASSSSAVCISSSERVAEELSCDAPSEDPLGADGNLETCHVCGVGGLLICCEACPEVYHLECLAEEARPPDDDSAWFCPVCTEAMARNER